ncbi:MAG TPA: hypothetical protein VFU23_13475 [Gemmatimonadales bacterium]|nr:hypothetical protein [Gemmatimonadales bacterium]
MMDEREDRFDEMLRDAARDYHAPPPTPRAEMWARIQAARQVRTTPVTPLRRPTFRILLAVAAVLAIGVLIGRMSAPGITPVAPSPGTVAATPGSEKKEKSNIATELATVDHLSQVETFLTEFGTEKATPEFTDHARDLLGTTRLLLDSKRVTDPRTRKLLEDLELVLVQIATLNPRDRREDLNSIADGLAQNQLRTRLRNAIPAGSLIRL